jgi:isopenicillin-N N-acyltransferase like protein
MSWSGRVLISLLISFLPIAGRAETPFRFPEAKHGKGELKYVQGIPILTVEGSSSEIGEQVAVLALKPAKRVLDYPKELLHVIHMESTLPVLTMAGKAMVMHFPSDYREELEAIAKVGVDRDAVVLGNTMFDIKNAFACSALIVEANRSATKAPLFGRNLDYPSLGYIHQYSLVTIYRSKGKHTFAAISFPGLVGCLSGMNDAGLCLGVLEVRDVKEGTEKFNAFGTPYALCYRRILEECSTVQDAEKLLKSMPRTTLGSLAICDPSGGAVFEMTPKQVVVRRPEQGLCSCTNHFLSKELKPRTQPNVFWTLDRFEILERARQLPKVGLDDLHQTLHAVSVKTHTLQTMIFEPAKLRLHLSIGSCPASANKLTALDLAPLLQNGMAKENREP